MAVTCKNCGRPVKFDPDTQRVSCDYCGSKFVPETIEEYGKDVLEQIEPSSIPDLYMDSYVYICSSCGGQIIINGTESSTSCVYCGGSSIVFNRIIKQKRPQFIIPFKVTKEEALDAIKDKLGKGLLVPREIKHFKQEDVRGIYIPYWIVDADHYGTVAIEGVVTNGRTAKSVYYARSGFMKVHDLPIDASDALSNESSERLEPFNLNAMKPFNESYLLGFYSNISDITYRSISDLVNKRAQSIFEEHAKNGVESDREPTILSSSHETEIDYNSLRYAMFPAWFVSYRFKGQYNTILVNGETGKVVCGVPWNRNLVASIYVVLSVILTILSFFFARAILVAAAEQGKMDNDYRMLIYVIGIFIGGSIFALKTGYTEIRKLIRSLNLAQDVATYNFMKRRQG